VKTDRDVSIERLLRSLRPQEPAGGDCPDVEALAALADNGLSAADRQAMETHIADCHRCQALTAAMARTASAAPPEPGANRVALPWWKSRRTLNWLVPAAAAAKAVRCSNSGRRRSKRPRLPRPMRRPCHRLSQRLRPQP
jgi:anti-sigma factor RsiW